MRYRFTYAVTFEFEERAPLTLRGQLDGTGPAVAAARAVRLARTQARQIPGNGRLQPCSMSVLLEYERGEKK